MKQPKIKIELSRTNDPEEITFTAERNSIKYTLETVWDMLDDLDDDEESGTIKITVSY